MAIFSNGGQRDDEKYDCPPSHFKKEHNDTKDDPCPEEHFDVKHVECDELSSRPVQAIKDAASSVKESAKKKLREAEDTSKEAGRKIPCTFRGEDGGQTEGNPPSGQSLKVTSTSSSSSSKEKNDWSGWFNKAHKADDESCGSSNLQSHSNSNHDEGTIRQKLREAGNKVKETFSGENKQGDQKADTAAPVPFTSSSHHGDKAGKQPETWSSAISRTLGGTFDADGTDCPDDHYTWRHKACHKLDGYKGASFGLRDSHSYSPHVTATRRRTSFWEDFRTWLCGDSDNSESVATDLGNTKVSLKQVDNDIECAYDRGEDPNAKFGPSCPDYPSDTMIGKLFGSGSGGGRQRKKVSFFKKYFCEE